MCILPDYMNGVRQVTFKRINYLPNIFDSNCDPVKMGDISTSSMIYADDLLILSESLSGLQHYMDNLKLYCIRWSSVRRPDDDMTFCIIFYFLFLTWVETFSPGFKYSHLGGNILI